MNLDQFFTKTIRYSFFILVFFTPLIFTPINYELFEFNKMVLVYVLTTVITASWLGRMIVQKRWLYQPTIFDFFILLFLTSQLISTYLSIDRHTSIWGYYTRSHGGLLSSFCYALLYWAYVSNSKGQRAKGKGQSFPKIVVLMLAAGALVAGYGILEHFGIDKNMWIQDVQNRVFSTLGQPNWLAAYLNAIIFIPLGFWFKHKDKKIKIVLFLLFLLFYITLVFTKSKSGLAAFWIGLLVFYLLAYLHKAKSVVKTGLVNIIFLALVTGLFYPNILTKFNKIIVPSPQPKQNITSTLPAGAPIRIGGSPTNEIRRVVWMGALNIWQAYPLFGSGNATFAYSYYQYRPQEHNLNSEWDFLYNKAHNEYLNYLATTGLVGLVAVLAWQLSWPLWLWWQPKKKFIYRLGAIILGVGVMALNPANIFDPILNKILFYPPITKPLFLGLVIALIIANFWFYLYHKTKKSKPKIKLSWLIISMLAGWSTIFLTNFYGFSVVIIGVFAFLFPAIIWTNSQKPNQDKTIDLAAGNLGRDLKLIALGLMAVFILGKIYHLWEADRLYTQGKNQSDSGQYLAAFETLTQAEKQNPGEPIIKAQLGETASALAFQYYRLASTDSAQIQQDLTQLAVDEGLNAITISPFNISYYKSLAKIYLNLPDNDNSNVKKAIEALATASQISPTDPKLRFNIALLSEQVNDFDQAAQMLNKAIELKPDYDHAYVYLARLYLQQNQQDQAAQTYQALLRNFYPPNQEALDFLQKYNKPDNN